MAYVDGELVVNPNAMQREKTQMSLTVASTKEKVVYNKNQDFTRFKLSKK